MLHEMIIRKLEENAETFKTLLGNLSEEQAEWKPSPDKWSMLKVVNHLHDEEIDDFRQRLEFALVKPDKPWKRIAPGKWFRENRYDQREMGASLAGFLAERCRSVQWLKQLGSVDWNSSDGYPHGTILTAEQILVNWLAHDYLHIRQINALNWGYLVSLAPSVDLGYAGDW